ncbi:hypothetical protein [Methanobrevibacter sp.]|uniref:hypothetical protein n=1 Tax=Methanobrevibacter sp. TaxID=66852 RepID=UPI0038901EED
MDAMEVVAILILIVAIVVLVYYYLLNSPATMDKLRGYVPTTADAHMNEILGRSGGNTEYDLTKEDHPAVDGESESVGKRIKVKLSDIDVSGLKSDTFSKKIDAFLDEKSDQLIKDWSLATTNDLEELQTKFGETTANVDKLDKSFNEFKKSSEEFQKATEEKLNDLDKRIESLENN